jgi:hypothetical protein
MIRETSGKTWLRENVDNYADDLRRLIDLLGWSQRRAAHEIDIPEGDFRSYCRGRPCPRYVPLALEFLVSQIPSGAITSEDRPAGRVITPRVNHERA